jgi:hypothetical protein
MQDSRWNKMKNFLLAVYLEGVASIVPTLKTANSIRAFSQGINYFAFAFITPLQA